MSNELGNLFQGIGNIQETYVWLLIQKYEVPTQKNPRIDTLSAALYHKKIKHIKLGSEWEGGV